jgi:hypothetical protein
MFSPEKCSVLGGLDSDDSSHWPGVVLIFLGLFLTGFGTSVFYSLSMAYLVPNFIHNFFPQTVS